MGLWSVRGNAFQGYQKGSAQLEHLGRRVSHSLIPLFPYILTHTHFEPSCPPGETPGESPAQMSARVDRVIAKVRALHAEAENAAENADEVDYSDVMIFSHGHFSRCFIARWCDLPIKAGYHFAAEAGGVSFLFSFFSVE